MTYDDALAWWYGRIDFERKAPKPGDLKLDRMRAVLRAVGDPHRRLRIIHVAGTKGKGSTSAMLAAVLQAAGYRVGLFTSPHLSDVSERIQVDGVPISRAEMTVRMTEIAEAVRPMEESADPSRIPTFFEIGTVLGYLHFVCRQVDLAVIEVGLGGRLDSTNVCTPLVSVITNISFDHMQLLGNTLALIAREKAGIIKPGRPVISTAEAPEATAVIERVAAERRAPLQMLGRDFRFDYRDGELRAVTRVAEYPWLKLGLAGHHQAANAAGAIVVVEQLRALGLTINDAALASGLANVRWPARMELVGSEPLIILDCAHNVASAGTLIVTLRESFPVTGRRIAVLAFSNDKQVAEMLQVLGPAFDFFHLTRYTNSGRALPPAQLAELLRAAHPAALFTVHESPADALHAARASARADDLIAISGSVFLAGELRPLLVAS